MRGFVVLGLLAAFAYFIWPTLWQVESHGPGLVTRTHRLTGKQEVRTEEGWVGVQPFATSPIFQVNVSMAKTQMSNFAQAIELYKMDNKKLPTSLEDLTQINERNPNPYMKNIPKDPWGQPYEYRPTGKDYTIRSYGDDQQPDTPDDVVYPEAR